MMECSDNSGAGSHRYRFSVSVNRRLTSILLAIGDVDSTTPESDDGFGPWPTSDMLSARAAPTDSELATREVVEPMRSVAGRHIIHAPETPTFSYKNWKEGGVFDRQTFCYVPDNTAYAAWKATDRPNVDSQRRCYGLGRFGKTKSTRGGEAGEAGGTISRLQGGCDETSTLRRDSAALRQHRTNSGTSQTMRSNNDPVDQPDTVDLSSQHQLRYSYHVKQKDARMSRVRNSSEMTAEMCSGDVDHCDKVNPEQYSDSRVLKTWLYSFLPPIVTIQLGHGDADPPGGNLTDVRGCLPLTSRCAVSRRSRHPGDERYPTVCGRKLRTRADEGSVRPPLTPAASDAAEHCHRQGRGHVSDVERRRVPGTATDHYQVFLTEVCQPSSNCDCPHHQDVYSDDEDATASASRFAAADDDDEDDNDDDGSSDQTADDDDDDDNDDDDDEKEE